MIRLFLISFCVLLCCSESPKHKNTIMLASKMDSSLTAVNKVLSDYLKPIEIIERQKREIHYRDSLIRDMIIKIDKANRKGRK